MALDKKTIQKIADLAKLNLSAKEFLSWPKQLGKIMAYVDKINKLKLENVSESLTGVSTEKSVWREDKVKIFKGQHLNQGKKSGDLLIVPKVFDK
jgi:aspartyl-tRNA(Asn)/glutamyl-tRNA(Gln) amidotransferase subunit C